MNVIKRDGSQEEFDKYKIARVVTAAGLSKEDASILANRIADWANEQNHDITSLMIRDEVLKELKKTDQSASNMFEWYEKTKDRNV